jgi:hypothetical protein
LSELLKRVIEAGAKNLSAEPMRQLLAEMKLPKDALLHLLSQHLMIQLEETKENIYRLIARELKDLLERTNLAEEIARALTGLSLDVTMRVRFSPTDGESPSLRLEVTPRAEPTTAGAARTSVAGASARAPSSSMGSSRTGTPSQTQGDDADDSLDDEAGTDHRAGADHRMGKG